MTTREDYLRRAEECIEMAKRASPDIRKKLHEVARLGLSWHGLNTVCRYKVTPSKTRLHPTYCSSFSDVLTNSLYSAANGQRTDDWHRQAFIFFSFLQNPSSPANSATSRHGGQ
jgi:hypothetical protein